MAHVNKMTKIVKAFDGNTSLFRRFEWLLAAQKKIVLQVIRSNVSSKLFTHTFFFTKPFCSLAIRPSFSKNFDILSMINPSRIIKINEVSDTFLWPLSFCYLSCILVYYLLRYISFYWWPSKNNFRKGFEKALAQALSTC